MQKIHQFTAVIEREDNMYVALCPELDIASQGETVERAKSNAEGAWQGWLEYQRTMNLGGGGE